jgi:integrase/recombinase XerD
MTTVDSSSQVILRKEAPFTLGEDQLAAVAFLARYSGRTLEAYRHDLRALFQWAADHDLPVLEASRAHLELYRSSMEERGLAASTIDRRLSTACGFYRFAHIDGRISSNPAQYVRRPTVQPSEGRGLDRGELARLLFTAERFDHAHAALAVLLGLNGLRVSEACGANIEDMGMERGHRVLRIVGKGFQAGPHSLGAAHGPGHRSGRRRTSGRSDPAPPGRPPSGSAHRSPLGDVHGQPGGARVRAPVYAPGGLHHGRP